VALQGTLDTFSLPDVLRLLATTGKTGCLHVDGDRGRGKVWIDGGALVGATADRALGQPSIDEVVFEMLRIGRGSFRFAVDEKAPDTDVEPTEIEGTLRRAGQLLEEWRELEAIVPSLSHRVAMAPELTVEQVTVDADRWKALVAISSGRSVGELAEALGVGELGISRTVSDLVELGVAVIEPPGAARKPSGSSRRNVTDIASRAGGESPRRSRGDAAPRREPAPTSDGAPQVNWAQTAEPIAAPDTGGGLSRPASSTRMSSSLSSSRTATAPVSQAALATDPTLLAPAPPASHVLSSPATAVGVVTPAAGTPSIDSGPKARRQASPARPPRPRRTSNAPTSGQTPVTGPLRGSTLPVPPPAVDVGLAAMPAPLGEPTTSGPIFPPSLETSPPSGLLLPPSLDTGRLGPSPLPHPTETGQIPAVSATSLPPDLSWAAEDNEAPIGPPPLLSSPPPLRPQASVPPPPPTRLLASQGPRTVMGVRHEGDIAPHLVAMTPEARQAVEAAVGRSGGGPGGMPMAGATQEQILSRGQLFHYLSSIRG
jgi:hypothetical protein